MTAMGTQLSDEQLSKAWVALELRPSTIAELESDLKRKKERLEELKDTFIVDFRVR